MDDPNRKPILEVKGVSKSFGAVQALRDVDFEVFNGEVVGLLAIMELENRRL